MSKLLCITAIFCAILHISCCHPFFSHKLKYSPSANFSKPLGLGSDYRWDWRERGVVSPVKDQKNCSASWAFAITAYAEVLFRMYQNPLIFSEQLLIDCVEHNNGCNKSDNIIQSTGRAISHVATVLGGLVSEEEYPYVGRTETCRFDPVKDIAKLAVTSSGGSTDPWIGFVIQYLIRYRPIIASINSASMKKYGKSNHVDRPTEEECSSDPSKLDHVVLIVGIGTEEDKTGNVIPYFIIKNSWGENWGDKGYYYLIFGNGCGILNGVFTPALDIFY